MDIRQFGNLEREGEGKGEGEGNGEVEGDGDVEGEVEGDGDGEGEGAMTNAQKVAWLLSGGWGTRRTVGFGRQSYMGGWAKYPAGRKTVYGMGREWTGRQGIEPDLRLTRN